MRLLAESDNASARPHANSAGQLVFESNRGGNQDIWMISIANPRAARQLTTAAGPDRYPSFHPNGSDFFFLSNRSGEGAAFFRGRVGRPTAQLLVQVDEPSFGSWTPGFASPDSTRFLYAAGGSVWTINLFTGSRMQLFEGAGPSWHPDGDKILFRKKARDFGRYVSTSIWLATEDGINITEVLPGNENITLSWARVSPDGTRVCYTKREILNGSRGSFGDSDIWVANIDGNQQIPVTSAPGRDDQCGWLDDQHLVFVSDRPTGSSGAGSLNLWIADLQ